eukprot:s90_g22.t1
MVDFPLPCLITRGYPSIHPSVGKNSLSTGDDSCQRHRLPSSASDWTLLLHLLVHFSDLSTTILGASWHLRTMTITTTSWKRRSWCLPERNILLLTLETGDAAMILAFKKENSLETPKLPQFGNSRYLLPNAQVLHIQAWDRNTTEMTCPCEGICDLSSISMPSTRGQKANPCDPTCDRHGYAPKNNLGLCKACSHSTLHSNFKSVGCQVQAVLRTCELRMIQSIFHPS